MVSCSLQLLINCSKKTTTVSFGKFGLQYSVRNHNQVQQQKNELQKKQPIRKFMMPCYEIGLNVHGTLKMCIKN